MIKLNPAESSPGHDSLVQWKSTDVDENHGLVIFDSTSFSQNEVKNLDPDP